MGARWTVSSATCSMKTLLVQAGRLLTEYLSILLRPRRQLLPRRSEEYCRGPIRNKTRPWMTQWLEKKKHSLNLPVIRKRCMDSADTPGCINGESSTLDGDTRVKQLTLMNTSLQKCNEPLQQELKALLTQPQRQDVRVFFYNSEFYMYTGLNCTAFIILVKWLEPVLPI